MELTQAARRIFLQHWKLIAACVLVATAAVLVLELRNEQTYTGSTRLVLDTQDPTTRQEAAAIGDTATGIATSAAEVTNAMRKAGVTGRDPVEVARDDVTVRSLGSSGVLELSVTDRDPRAAAAIANALASGVISTRLGFTRGVSRTVLTDLDKRLSALRERLAGVDGRIAGLDRRLAGIDPAVSASRGREAVLRSARDAAMGDRQSLAAQQGVLESERVSLLTAAASKPRPAIVAAASPPAHADPTELPVHVVLAVLVGLICGVGLAALLETIRPTIVGSDAVAREFGAPLLGTLAALPDREEALADLSPVMSRLSLATAALKLASVRLVAAGPQLDLRPLASRLDAVGSEALTVAAVHVAPRSAVAVANGESGWEPAAPECAADTMRVDSNGARVVPSTNGHGAGGVVVVAPSRITARDAESTSELLRIIPTRILGVITYDESHR